MTDVLFVGIMVAFFALAVVLVHVCDRIIGADEDIVIGTVDYPPDRDEIAA